MSSSMKKERKNPPRGSHSGYAKKAQKPPQSPASEPKRTTRITTPSVANAQAEFLEDIRLSFQDMKDGNALPAEEALELLELGLDDDELEGYLPQ